MRTPVAVVMLSFITVMGCSEKSEERSGRVSDTKAKDSPAEHALACYPVVTPAQIVTGKSDLSASTVTKLGFGYKLVPRTVDVSGIPNHFEGLAHYSDLYCDTQRLGQAGKYSVSPSGRYALFEDAGKLLLFVRNTRLVYDVTDRKFEVPCAFTWIEDRGVVRVEYYTNHAPSTISYGK